MWPCWEEESFSAWLGSWLNQSEKQSRCHTQVLYVGPVE